MNYPVYNPYLYSQNGAQPPQQGPFIQPQSVQQQAQNMPQGLSQLSRPVTSREEAMGVAADFSGALMLFPDVTHNRVYIKRWNYQSGAADFVEFAPVISAQPQQDSQPQPLFASLQDFQDLQSAVDNLRQELEQLKKPQARTAAKKEKTDANE